MQNKAEEVAHPSHILASERTRKAELVVGTQGPIEVVVAIYEVTDVRDRTRRIRREGDLWSKDLLTDVMMKERTFLHYPDGEIEEIMITGTLIEQSDDFLITHATFANRKNIRV